MKPIRIHSISTWSNDGKTGYLIKLTHGQETKEISTKKGSRLFRVLTRFINEKRDIEKRIAENNKFFNNRVGRELTKELRTKPEKSGELSPTADLQQYQE